MYEKEFYSKFLNEIEIAELESLTDRITLKQAIKKVLLSVVYFQGTLEPGKDPDPMQNFMLQLPLNDGVLVEHLGKVMKAKVEGVRLVQMGFDELEKFKRSETIDTKEINEAR